MSEDLDEPAPNCSCGRYISCDEPERYPVCRRCRAAHLAIEAKEHRRMLREMANAPAWLSADLTDW